MNIQRILSAAALLATIGHLTACSQGESNPPPPPMPAAAITSASAPLSTRTAVEPVDVCALLTQADAETLIGALNQAPVAGTPRGSLLGECRYLTASGTSISLSAHPAREFDGSAEYTADKKNPAKTIAGLGSKAVQTAYGVMVQPDGQRYFLSVFVLAMPAGAIDGDLSLKAARKLKL